MTRHLKALGLVVGLFLALGLFCLIIYWIVTSGIAVWIIGASLVVALYSLALEYIPKEEK